MSTDFNKNALSSSGGFKPMSADTPLDIRTVVESEADILSVPRPFIGMVIYAKDTGKRYEVLTLKDIKVGLTNVKNGAVDTYQELPFVNKEFFDEKIEEIDQEMAMKVDKVEGKALMDEAEIARLAEVHNYDDAELRSMLEAIEIPSVEGLASEEFVNQQIAAIPEVDLEPYALKEEVTQEMVMKVDKVEGKALMDEAEIARLAKVDNYDDVELRELIDEEKPYLADVAAYPTSKFLFACGQPITVEPNVGQKYSVEHAEDAVAFVYRWAKGFESIVVVKVTAAKVYLVGGYGHEHVNVKRPIPQTNMLVRNVKIKGLVGGSYFEGMVGHVNIEAENCEFVSVMGAGWCGASVKGTATRMNIADDVNIKMTNCKISSTFFGGSQGNGVADDVNVEFNNCEIGWLTAGGANGMTRNVRIVMNGGSVKVAQSTNRGVVNKAKFVLNDGVVEKLYFGGETEDASVNGIIENGFIELNGGQVKEFCFGTNNGVELTAGDMRGCILDCEVVNGDISMLEKIERPVEVLMATKEYVDQQIAAIPQHEAPNFEFEVEVLEDGEGPVVEQVGVYPNLKFIFKLPLCYPVNDRIWYGYIPFDEEGKAGFCEVNQINEFMTYHTMAYGIGAGTLTEADDKAIGVIDLYNVPDCAFVCAILPVSSQLKAFMDNGIGGKVLFAEFDTASGLALDNRTLVNSIEGNQYRLSGFYVTNGGGNFKMHIN